MTIPSWPNGLPYASSYAGFSVQQTANPVLSTDMNAGTTRQRRISTIRIGMQKLSIEMKAADVATFDAFHASLGDGAARFSMPVWNGATYSPRNVQIVKGTVTKAQPGVDTQAVGFTIRIENP